VRGPAKRDELIWGWLRLALGVAQIVLSTAALALLSAVGLRSITWVFILSAAIAMVVSAFFITAGPAPD
jgi:hypothetical protein